MLLDKAPVYRLFLCGPVTVKVISDTDQTGWSNLEPHIVTPAGPSIAMFPDHGGRTIAGRWSVLIHAGLRATMTIDRLSTFDHVGRLQLVANLWDIVLFVTEIYSSIVTRHHVCDDPCLMFLVSILTVLPIGVCGGISLYALWGLWYKQNSFFSFTWDTVISKWIDIYNKSEIVPFALNGSTPILVQYVEPLCLRHHCPGIVLKAK